MKNTTLRMDEIRQSGHRRFSIKNCSYKFRRLHMKKPVPEPTLLKKRLWQRCFLVNFTNWFYKSCKNTFLHNTCGQLLLHVFQGHIWHANMSLHIIQINFKLNKFRYLAKTCSFHVWYPQRLSDKLIWVLKLSFKCSNLNTNKFLSSFLTQMKLWLKTMKWRFWKEKNRLRMIFLFKNEKTSLNSINAFQSDISFLCPLKTLENL